MSIANQSARRYIALGLWLVVSVLFFSLAWQWVTFTSSDQQLTEYTFRVVQRAALDRRPLPEVRLMVVAKAEQLSIRVPDDGIRVTGEPGKVRTAIAYDTEIKIPIIDHVLYRMQFNHDLNSTDWR